MTARLSININDECAAYLKEQAQVRGITVTELIRRTISLDKLIHDEQEAGCRIVIQADPTKELRPDRQLVIL